MCVGHDFHEEIGEGWAGEFGGARAVEVAVVNCAAGGGEALGWCGSGFGGWGCDGGVGAVVGGCDGGEGGL